MEKRCPRCQSKLMRDADGDYYCPGSDIIESCSYAEFKEEVERLLTEEEVSKILEEAECKEKK